MKCVKKPSFFDIFLVISEVFWTFLVLGLILAHQTTKFELSGWFCFSRHPWDTWGRLNSGVTQELVKSVTVMSTNKVALEHRSYKITPSIIDVWKWLQYINFYQQCPWFKIYRWLCLPFFYFFPLNFYLLLIARTH